MAINGVHAAVHVIMDLVGLHAARQAKRAGAYLRFSGGLLANVTHVAWTVLAVLSRAAAKRR